MYYKFNASICKSLIKSLALTGFLVFILACSSASAQRHSNGGLTYGGGSNGGGTGWGIAFMGGYDVPTGDLATTYKAAPTFGISVIHNLGDFTFNGTIGFVSYKPKLDTFYFDGADKTAGYIKYGSFSSLEFYAGAAYNIAIADQAKLYIGLNIGSYYNSFSYDSNDGAGGENVANTSDEESYIAPKLGVNFMISDDLSLGIEGKYNFILSSSSGTGDAYDYGYTTSVTKTYTGSLILTYNF